MSKRRKAKNINASQQQAFDGPSILTLDAFANALARLGFGQANIPEATEYPMTRLSRDFQKLTSLYRDHWLVKRLINTIPEDMVKNWYKIQSQMPPDDITKIERLERITHLRQRVVEGLRWGRLYGGAAAVMIIDGHEDILDEPLDLDMVMPESFRGILVFDRWSGIYPLLDLINDTTSTEFGLPEYYQVVADGVDEMIVHHSRVLRFTGRDLPHWEKMAEQYWGASEIEHVFTELTKRDNTSANVANLLYIANLRVMKMADLGQMLASGSDQQIQRIYRTLSAQNWLMNNMGMHVMDSADGFETHQYAFSGLSDVYEMFMLDLAGAAEMPVTKLFGRSPAGMNATGDSDMQNYYDLLEQQQETHIRPLLEKLLPVMCMSEFGAVPDDLDIKFNPVRKPTEDERRNLGKNIADAVVEVYNAGIVSMKTAMQELRQSSDVTGMWSNISDADIDNAPDTLGPSGEDMSGMGSVLGSNMPITDGGPGSGRKPEGGSKVDHKTRKEYNKALKGVKASTGTVVSSVTNHAIERAVERRVSSDDINDALSNTRVTYPINTNPKNGKKSQRLVGERAGVAINPDTGAVISVWVKGDES